MSPRKDEMVELLTELDVPETPVGAEERLLNLAKAQPRKQRAWLAALRRLRAWIYVPQMRYAIMASVVALFIGLGAINQASRQGALPTDLLLYDVEFATFETEELDWIDTFDS